MKRAKEHLRMDKHEFRTTIPYSQEKEEFNKLVGVLYIWEGTERSIWGCFGDSGGKY